MNSAKGPSSRRRRHDENPRSKTHGWKNEFGEQTEPMGNQGPAEQHEAKSVAQITPQQKNGKAQTRIKRSIFH
jgi:hypothetical protein